MYRAVIPFLCSAVMETGTARMAPMKRDAAVVHLTCSFALPEETATAKQSAAMA